MDDQVLLFLLTSEIEQAYHNWDIEQPARTGLHASSVLESESDFCTRQHVLAEHYPDERQAKDLYLSVLQKFVHGWAIHKKLQEEIFLRTGRVVPVGYNDDFYSKMEYELDHTHVDDVTGIHFSPDVIIQYGNLTLPVEIKGINHEDFAGQEELYKPVVKSLAFDVRSVSYEKVQDARPGVVGATLTEAAARNKSIRSAIPQLNLYLRLLGLTEAPNNRGIIFAEDKNTQAFAMWVHTYDAQLAVQPVDRAMQVKMLNAVHKANGKLPHGICDFPSESRAKRCPFRDACFTRE